jgi:hypothetical protein
MARKRIALPYEVETEIATRTARGETAETIYDVIHGAISIATIRRRQRELRDQGGDQGATTPKGAQTLRPELEIPGEVPSNAKIEDVDRWLARLEQAAQAAETNGNLAAIASLTAKMKDLAALRHKMQPPKRQDPNEREDMQVLGSEVERRFLALIHDAFHPADAA